MNRYLRQRHTARITGTVVELYDAEHPDSVFDKTGGRWVTICEHGCLVNHDTLSLARCHASDPGQWCDECEEIVK